MDAQIPPSEKNATIFQINRSTDLVTHRGGCHCGAVRFEVLAPKDIVAIDCNCSICTKKSNLHFIVPSSRFKLVQGEAMLTTYTFNTHVAKHMFCKVCGVQSFYRPRSNPDGYGINPRCLDPETVGSIKIVTFDGQQWENTMQNTNIKDLSKE
eukprot:TRINITY_DN5625_c0_g1_i1.p1 TRINITY_DN5625_c0_g1~~TRINITY_DN5625_c0_g1_i1.p1  ORF type:complete len:153 (-),score=1.44 TRINITY_DN5625_c0_g1_i1:49-507(-)